MLLASLFGGSPSLLTLAVIAVICYFAWKYFLAPTPAKPSLFGSMWSTLPLIVAATPHVAKWLYNAISYVRSGLADAGAAPPADTTGVATIGPPAVNSPVPATPPIVIHLVSADPALKVASVQTQPPATPAA